jgi:hypothetical protein
VKLYTTLTPVLPDGGGGKRIVLAWIPYNGAKRPQTIIYSHPNALDLGQCIPYCTDLGKLLGAAQVCPHPSRFQGSSQCSPFSYQAGHMLTHTCDHPRTRTHGTRCSGMQELTFSHMTTLDTGAARASHLSGTAERTSWLLTGFSKITWTWMPRASC